MYDKEREFNGILVEAQWLGVKNDYYSYRLVLRPWLWLLSRTTDCRIFQDKKAPDIIKEVFNDRGFTDYESELTEEGFVSEARILRSVSRDRPEFRQPADGAARHLLFLQA